MNNQFALGVIGGGFMARAILDGAVKSGFLSPEEICVSEPCGEKREAFLSDGFSVVSDNRMLAGRCRFLLFAVKPQVFPEVAAELKGADIPVVISIMAGLSKQKLVSLLGVREKVARVMPNLPCSVGEGMSAVDVSLLSEEEKAFVIGLFSATGKVIEADESLFGAVTAISGSGPAYVYLFMKSLMDAGVKEGLSPQQAKTLVLQTLKGGLKMTESSDKTLDELIAAVSSKGGTTVAALVCFEKDDFAGSVRRAVSAAVRRAEELSK